MFRTSFRTRSVVVFTLFVGLVVFASVKFGPASEAQDRKTSAAPQAASVVATLTDNVPAATKVAPGGTITYTATITNNGVVPGTDDATSVIFTDQLDANTTLVPGSLTVTPIVSDDPNYAATGNVRIQPTAANGVLANDINPGGGSFTASAGPTSANGGNVTMNADGSFIYNPRPGFTGTDTFTYTATGTGGGTANGTVTINVSGLVWFVNSAAPAGGDGRLATPFNCLTGAGCFSAVNDGAANHPADNQFIFLYRNPGPPAAFTGGLQLRIGQKLIGEAATAPLATIAGITLPPAINNSDALPATGLASPVISTVAAATNGINLASGNTLRGFTVGNTTGFDIAGSNFGTLTVSEVGLNGSGGLLNLSTGTLAATFGILVSSSSTAQGLILNVVGGSLTATGVSISAPTTQCLLVSGSTVNANFGGTTCSGGTDGISLQNNSAGTRTFVGLTVGGGTGSAFVHGAGGGNVSVTAFANLNSPLDAISVNAPGATNVITFSGSGGGGSGASAICTTAGCRGVNWVGTAGATMTFNDLVIQTNAGIGLNATTGGTINVTNATATSTINNTAQAAPAIVAANVALNANFVAIKSSGGANGVSLTNVGGSSNFGTATINGQTGDGVNITNSAGNVTISGGTIGNPAANAVEVNGSNGNVTIAATLTKTTAGKIVLITGRTGNTVALSGNISATGAVDNGIDVNNNTAGIVNFTGQNQTLTTGGNTAVNLVTNGTGVNNFAPVAGGNGLDISTTSGAGFNASGSGTVTVQGAGNTITSTTGTALSVVNPIIAATNMTFESISANGGAKGIILNATGSSGGLIVTGTGTTDGSGGTIQNATTRGAELISANNITLKNMNFTNNGTAAVGGMDTRCADALNQSTTAIATVEGLNCQANVYLQSTNTVVLDNVNATLSNVSGIWGNNVNGLTLTNVEARQNGDEVLEDGVQMVNLAGTVNVTGGNFRDNASHSFEVQNNSGSPTITLNNDFFGNTNFPTAGGTAPSPSNSSAASTVLLATNGNSGAFITSTVTGCTFDKIFSIAFHVDMGDGNNRQNVTFGQPGAGNGNTVTTASQGITMVGTNDVTPPTKALVAHVVNNTVNNDETLMDTFSSTNINFRRGGGLAPASGDWDVVVDGNTVGINANALSGCEIAGCNGITADDQGSPSGTLAVLIQNNSVFRVYGAAIQVGSANAGAHTVQATIINNVVNDPETNGTGAVPAESQGPGILVFSGTSATSTTRVRIEDNDVDGGWDNVGANGNIRARHAGAAGSQFFLCNFVLASSSANVSTHLTAENPLSSAPAGFVVATAAIGAGLTVANGCPTVVPTIPPPGEEAPGLAFLGENGVAGNDLLAILRTERPVDVAKASVENGELRIENGESLSNAEFGMRNAESLSNAERGMRSAESDLKEMTATGYFVPEMIETHPMLTATGESIPAAVETKTQDNGLLARLAEMISPTVYSAESTPFSGETITVNGGGGGFTLPAGKTVTITYQATVNSPPQVKSLSTQGTVTFAGGPGSPLLTDDPEPAGGPQATVTQVDTLMTWNGATSTDWNTATNWTPPAGGTAYAPGVSNPAINDVVIPNVGNQPSITATDIGVYSLIINNGRTLTITSPRVLTIGGSPGGNLQLDGIITGGNLNLGTGAHTITNAGGTGSLSSTNVATVLSGGTVTLAQNLQAGALAVNAGGSMDITNRTLSLNGVGGLNVPAGATFTTTGSTVVFNGSAAQSLSAPTLNNLTINNAAGVSLTGNAAVNGLLTLTSGNLDAVANTLTVNTVSRTSGHVLGNMRKVFGAPGPVFVYHVGTANGYSPIDVTVTAGTGELTAKANQGDVPAAPPLTPNTFLKRFWTLAGSGITSDIVFHYLQPPDVTGNEGVYQVIRVTGGTAIRYVTSPTIFVTPASDTFTVMGLSSYSEWLAGEPLAPTAANVGVSGRVFNSTGRGVAGAIVRMTDPSGNTVYALTNPFGYYRFEGVASGQDYVVTVASKQYTFAPRVVSVSDSITDLDFIAEAKE